MALKIGADPELFLRQRGKFVSGHGVIPGTKEQPHLVDRGAVQVDGMALEFNIDPAENWDDFSHNIDTVLRTLRMMVPLSYELSMSATADFGRKHMAKQPIEARLLGCDPDFDAYTGEQNPEPEAHPTMRAAGGHIHLGWTEGVDPRDPTHFELCRKVTKQMDYWIGLPSLCRDRDQKRQQMYGKPGAFRPKPYGVEYRTPSNYWLLRLEFMQMVFTNAQKGFHLLMNKNYELEEKCPEFVRKAWGKEWKNKTARDIMNDGDRYQAALVCDHFGIRR